MEDKCPFCGREARPVSSNPEDHCCWVGKYANDLKGVRSSSCYEAQIASLEALVREMGKLMSSNKVAWSYQVVSRVSSILNRSEVKKLMEEK